MIKIAIFASGAGTNAENIVKYFENNNKIIISYILTNNEKAGVIKRAEALKIPFVIFSKDDFYKTDKILNLLKNENIDFIILAGFLWLVPSVIVKNFLNKIINIHPALLPKYGGKGMYGDNVHKKVIENCESESGITIHYVNDKYDDGDIIFQAKCQINNKDTAEMLAQKIHKLEYEFFPKIIGDIISR